MSAISMSCACAIAHGRPSTTASAADRPNRKSPDDAQPTPTPHHTQHVTRTLAPRSSRVRASVVATTLHRQQPQTCDRHAAYGSENGALKRSRRRLGQAQRVPTSTVCREMLGRGQVALTQPTSDVDTRVQSSLGGGWRVMHRFPGVRARGVDIRDLYPSQNDLNRERPRTCTWSLRVHASSGEPGL